MVSSRFNKTIRVGERLYLYNMSSKALFEIDESMVKMLEDVNNIPEKTAEILYNNGIITESYEFETSRMINNFNNVKYDRKQMSIFLSMTASCNLNCSYCYQDVRKELNIHNCYFNQEKFEILYRFIQDSIVTNGTETLTVFLFGGEPMLNAVRLEEYIKKLRDLDIKVILVLITNGTLFTEDNVEFFARNIDTIQITVDGKKEIHDNLRPYRNGKGTFDDIIRNLKMLSQHNPSEVTLRVNVNEDTIETTYEFIDYICDEGINDIVTATKFSPIFASQKDVMGCSNSNMNDDFSKRIGDLYLYAAKRGLNTFKDFDGGVCVGKIQTGYTIDENLNVYTCPGVLYEEACGKLSEDGLSINNSKWFNLVNDNSECVNKCTYAPICFGGCKWSGECNKKHLDLTFEKIMQAYIISFYDLRKEISING